MCGIVGYFGYELFCNIYHFHTWSKWELVKDKMGWMNQYRKCKRCNKYQIESVTSRDMPFDLEKENATK